MNPPAIATVSLSGSLESKLDAIARAGFRHVEIFENDLTVCGMSAAEVRARCRDLGLDIICLQPFRDYEGMPPELRERALGRAERKFDLMHALGTNLLLVCSNCAPQAQGGIQRAADDLRLLGERAGKHGLKIGFEALAWGNFISDYRDAWEVVRRADLANIGIILDSFHTLARKHDLVQMHSIPAEKIFLVQLADAPLLDMGLLGWSRHYRCFPGQGWLPIRGFMGALATTGYSGPLSLEVFNDQFRSTHPRQIALDGMRSMTYLVDLTVNNSGKDAKHFGHFQGVEFVEFCAADGECANLERVIARLGFAPRGQHRSKRVTLWSQGDINLLVNAEPVGFAHEYQAKHGTAICALGLRVDDAREAAQTAERYQCEPHHQQIGEGELSIPSVRTINDNLIYMIERHGLRGNIWDVDFTPVPPRDALPVRAGLTHIDHLGQVVPAGQMNSWVILYRAFFGFDALPQFDIPDPSGLVRSQVIESHDGNTSITLNASQSAGTLAAKFVQDYSGSGIQHVAFATHDIFATVRALQKNSVPLLDIPELYYADLAAKFGLSDAQVKELHALNLLYDRNESGEFYHAYTQSLDGRIFFEIVQRAGAYADYGQLNSPVRIAAQARAMELFESFNHRLAK